MSLGSEKKRRKEAKLSNDAELILREAMKVAESRKRPFYCI